MKPTLILAAVAAACLNHVATAQCPPDTAEYRLHFVASWSAATHPTDFPPNPHFSGLIGGTHDGSVSFWQPGMTASDGIERMAELGSKSALSSEVAAAIAAGSAGSVISGNGIALSPGAITHDFELSQSHPRVTVVSMLAPSPDWFVGVDGLALFDGIDWVDERNVDLHVYDAGTDSGVSYLSPNDDTGPAEPITLLSGYPLSSDGTVAAVGSFRFERLSETCSGDSDSDGIDDSIDNCRLVNNPNQRDTDADAIGNLCDPDIAPVTNDCQVNFLDLAVIKNAMFSSPGMPGWNPHADFDGDDRVGFSDLARMKSMFFAAPGPSAAGCN